MNAEKLKIGEVLSETQYYKVEKIEGSNVIANVDGEEVTLSKSYVQKYLNSAAQYSNEEKITRTELIEIFKAHPRIAMTVNFNKKVKDVDLKKQIHELYPNKGGKLMSHDDFKKAVNSAIEFKGEERTMIGRHEGATNAGGHYHFIDMELVNDDSKEYDTRLRLVDVRTLNWLIVKGVKYQVK